MKILILSLSLMYGSYFQQDWNSATTAKKPDTKTTVDAGKERKYVQTSPFSAAYTDRASDSTRTVVQTSPFSASYEQKTGVKQSTQSTPVQGATQK